MTDTRMLALIGDPKEDAYELLFSSRPQPKIREWIEPHRATDYGVHPPPSA